MLCLFRMMSSQSIKFPLSVGFENVPLIKVSDKSGVAMGEFPFERKPRFINFNA